MNACCASAVPLGRSSTDDGCQSLGNARQALLEQRDMAENSGSLCSSKRTLENRGDRRKSAFRHQPGEADPGHNQPFEVPSEFQSPDSARCPVSGEQFDPYFDRARPTTGVHRCRCPAIQGAASPGNLPLGLREQIGHSGHWACPNERQVSCGQRALGPIWRRTSASQTRDASCRPIAAARPIQYSPSAGRNTATLRRPGSVSGATATKPDH